MIQRIQSVYLALAFICMVLLLFFPIFSVEVSAAGTDFSILAEFGKDGLVGDGIESGKMPLYFVFIGLALLSAACALMFNRRPRQLLLCRLNLILHVLLVVGIYVFYYFGKPMVTEGIAATSGEEVNVVFYMEIGFFLLIPTIAFIWLAIRGIKRDENLVKSLDRLR